MAASVNLPPRSAAAVVSEPDFDDGLDDAEARGCLGCMPIVVVSVLLSLLAAWLAH